MKKNKKCGYSLMELIVVIAIIAILLSGYTLGANTYKSYLNEIDLKYSEDSILTFIINAKQYCREKSSSGYIFFDVMENEIRFYCNMKLVDRFKFPSSAKLYGINTSDSEIHIDNNGFTTNACSIIIKDWKGKIHSITMCVGTAYVEIQE